MNENQGISRRDMMKVAGAAGVGIAIAGCKPRGSGGKKKDAASTDGPAGDCGCGGTKLQFDNASFYDADGKFQVEKGKDAYIALMKFHGYRNQVWFYKDPRLCLLWPQWILWRRSP